MSIELALKQRRLLDHQDGEYTEIRIPSKGYQAFVKTEAEYEKEVAKHLAGDVYIGVNPRTRPEGTADAVAYFTATVVDIDPVRERGMGSTELQLGEAISLGERVAREYGCTVNVSSGSGCHVYLPLERTPNRGIAQEAKALQSWIKHLKKKYGTDKLRIDSTWDAPRIIRVWGSHNTKSNRLCTPISEPEKIIRLKAPWLDYVVTEEVKANLTVAESRFHRLCLTNPVLAKMMRQDAKYASRSEADYAFVANLIKAHFTLAEIKELVLLNPMGRQEEATEKYIETTYENALSNGIDTVSLNIGGEAYFKSLPTRKMGIRTGFKIFDEMVSGLRLSPARPK